MSKKTRFVILLVLLANALLLWAVVWQTAIIVQQKILIYQLWQDVTTCGH